MSSKNSRHGLKLSRKFEEQEKARRERLGLRTAVPQKEATENPAPRFNISGGARA
jgi:hypothetical protein